MSELEPLLDGVEDRDVVRHEKPEYTYADPLFQTRSRPSSISREPECHLSAISKSSESMQSHPQKNSHELTSCYHPTLSGDCEVSVSQLQSQNSAHFQGDSPILRMNDSPSEGLAEIDKFYDLEGRKNPTKDPVPQPSLGSPFQTPVQKPSGRRRTVGGQPKPRQITLVVDDEMGYNHAAQGSDTKQGGETNDSSSDPTSAQEDIIMEDVLRKQTSQQSSGTHELSSRQPGDVKKVLCNRIISPLQSSNTNDLSTNKSKQSNGKAIQQPAVILGDIDDLMIIEPSAASTFAKSKWSGEKNSTFSQLEDGSVKQEPTENIRVMQPDLKLAKKLIDTRLPNRNAAFAAQRAMLESTSAPLGPPQPAPSKNSLTLPQVPESSGGQGYISVEMPTICEVQDEGRSFLVRENNVEEVDAAMGGTDHFAEDNNWMHENAEDDQDKFDEYNQILRFKELLEKKEGLEGLNSEERMELNRARNQLKTKDRLREAAQTAALPDNQKRKQTGKKPKKATVEDDEDQDSLFLPESSQDKAQRQRHTRRQEVSPHDDTDDNIGMATIVQELMNGSLGAPNRPQDQTQPPDYGLTKAGKQRKRRPNAKDAKEVIQRQREDKIEKERKKEQKKKVRDEKASASRARKLPSSLKSKKGKGKQKRSKGKAVGAIKNGTSLLHHVPGMTNTDSTTKMMLNLITDDPLHNRLYNPIFNAGAEAEIVGKQNKESQFSQLFSNIPTQADIGGMGGGLNEVRSDKKALREASKAFGFAKVTAENGKWRIKGMKSLLYHHQLLGAQWMVQRELNSTKPHGGLLADSMGLGKTVQMLACMVGNPPTDGDLQRSTKATLIIVPAAVIDQWVDEIGVHVNKDMFPKILRYKRAHNVPPEILEDCDIVVTSYTDVMKEFPHPENKEEKAIWEKIGFSNWYEKFRDRLGSLHRVRWYRIVLDEAQAIKNNYSRTSISCMNLKGVYRWCLTGTPLLNRLEELFPYLRFLRAEYSLDYATFQKYFCDPNNEDCYSRIATVLGYTMMRRTMATTILNRPIITLPKPHPLVVYVDFSREEQIIYRITENRFRYNLNKFFKQGEAERNYSTFMVQLLRLRQCTSHPFMLEATIKEMWTLEDVAFLKKKLSALSGARVTNDETQKIPFYKQCQAWVEESESSRLVRSKEDMDEMLPFGASEYGYEFNINKALDTLNEKQMMARLNCAICQDLPSKPLQTDCNHIFCEECISNYMHDQTIVGMETMSCPNCGNIFSHLQPIDLPRGMRADEDDYIGSPALTSGGSKGKGKGKSQAPFEDPYSFNNKEQSKGRDILGCEPKTKYSAWITRSDIDDEFPLTPSAKTTMLKSILIKGFEEAPTDKVVIYVQFRALARIVGRICNAENWQFLYLTGDSTFEHRSRVIKRFRDDINVKILVAGLKCGGLGLNFPWANRCISLDLWWNYAVEKQAFGRIFRIGQCKETYMTRIVVKNSVDMRMLTMQLHKLKALEKAMRDGVENVPLSLAQITNLFGFLKTDEDNNILSVEPDYLEDEEDNGEGSATGVQEDREGN